MNIFFKLYYYFILIPMNTPELFDDYTEMTDIAKFAEENELTCDYVIEEFVINNQLVELK